MSANQSLSKNCIYIFAYAPAGLGHLRVVNALRQGLPANVVSYLFGADDKFITSFHRFASIHFATRWLMERIQRGILENWFTLVYRNYLRHHTSRFFRQISQIVDQNPKVSTVIVIATHFGLAHQLAVIKEKLIREKKTNILLVVQVTDDTPQHIWYVPGADIIFVPSDKTKNELITYGQINRLPVVRFETNPYPINPLLSNKLDSKNYQNRLSQADFQSDFPIHISIPIPGAAVGLNYLDILISHLRKKSKRFVFHIIGKQAPFTSSFINKYRGFSDVDLYVSSDDREVVRQYDYQYQARVISLEVTKPSEQAFKTLLNPDQVGGSILLFSHPVGKQEYDNLSFLHRHHLIPSPKHQNQIIASFTSNQNYSGPANWRGIILPNTAKLSAKFILWAIKSGLFTQMMTFRYQQILGDELGSNGVSLFWNKIFSLLY